MENTNGFLKWLGDDYKVVSIKEQVIGNTLTTDTYTLSDGRIFVVADRALVSYDNGYYMPYERSSETCKVIETIVWYHSWYGYYSSRERMSKADYWDGDDSHSE